MYNEYEIKPLPLSVGHCRRQVERFLAANGLRLESVDYYACVFRLGNDEEILAGGGLKGDVIKCVAVGDELRDEGFSSRLISHLISEARTQGHQSVKVFTKPSNQNIFESLGFHLIANAPHAIIMENGNMLQRYCDYLRSIRREGSNGAIVMNANPFTRGHQYLIETAASRVDWLYVIVVREDSGTIHDGMFPYAERKAMIEAGTRHISNVTVVEGSSFQVSSTTFPTYFLKQQDDATDTQISLDLDIFAKSIAPNLGTGIRFVGSEPSDMLTRRYNELMATILPKRGIEVTEIERLGFPNATKGPLGSPKTISASAVRKYMRDHQLRKAAQIVPDTTLPYLLAHLATSALRQELDLTPKPGLVDCNDNGAHKDMNHRLMCKSIEALHPYFVRIALLKDTPDYATQLQHIGIEAEEAMMKATNGINTHRGALFAMGITIAAATMLPMPYEPQELVDEIALLAQKMNGSKESHGRTVMEQYGVGGALMQAREGYRDLFRHWLPFYRTHSNNADGLHHTLLYIMSMLKDTNIYYRVGAEGAEQVRREAQNLLENYSKENMEAMNRAFIKQGISPGGCADMLALTIFIDSITTNF